MYCSYIFQLNVMHQNRYISYIIMSQLFLNNPCILEGCNHVTNALAGVKNQEGSDLISWRLDGPQNKGLTPKTISYETSA